MRIKKSKEEKKKKRLIKCFIPWSLSSVQSHFLCQCSFIAFINNDNNSGCVFGYCFAVAIASSQIREHSGIMDILDIDEALKDDSFIFLEDKTHDDVSNILQQWRNNNNCSTGHNSEQATFKLNTRTFTRPKRKSAQNMETQYNPVPQSQNATAGQQQNPSNINLEIGGLVTTMQKSFLQDTSPPSSICSSMEVSTNGMSGSLITSADFTNINFLQSTRGDDPMSALFFNTEKATADGYTLSDMIRDRKALESLTLSGEGTLIKDSNIAQIDDISLINSKTTSACSTMNNSTDSMAGSAGGYSDCYSNGTCNSTLQEQKDETSEKKLILNETFSSGKDKCIPNGDDDCIENITLNLVDSSIVTGHGHPVKDEPQTPKNETFRKPNLEETVCLKRFNVAEVINTTFDCSDTKPQCETPENAPKQQKYYEQSTPQHNSSTLRQKQSYTPSIKTAEVNISPIVGPATNRTLNETFDKSHTEYPVNVTTNILKERINNETFSEQQPFTRLPCNRNTDYETDVNLAFETMELLENINPNETFNKSLLGGTPAMDAVDEEAFDNLLDKIGKLELNDEQIKMRKSLDTIKKRFTYGMDKSEGKESSLNNSSEMASSGLSVNSSGNGDRLLSRRSRLYDDINITKSMKSSPSTSINSISYIKETDSGRTGPGQQSGETQKTDEPNCTQATESTEFAPVDEKQSRSSKLEKRDRDRFKTIRIFKRQEDGATELNVPCIDGEQPQHDHEPIHPHAREESRERTPQNDVVSPTERTSRRDSTPPIVPKKVDVESNNYATFKKPKDKVRRFGGFAAGSAGDQLVRPVIPPPATEKPTEQQRSLSRPRYISGLQKFSATGKAISAGDLEKAAQPRKGDGEGYSKVQASAAKSELKSPMGIKSKSFHNLSSNFGYGAAKAGPVLAAPIGVRKSTTAGSVPTEKQDKVNPTRTNTRLGAALNAASTNLKQPSSKTERSDDAVFKTPSLVSGLRAPSAKRTGLVRPSSGYYSFSVAKSAAGEPGILNAADLDAGRHSPTDSMSSASSRGSSIGKPVISNGISPESISMPPPPPPSSIQPPPAAKSTGIPKPSGLRPPSNIKRSGLPRPSSIVRR